MSNLHNNPHLELPPAPPARQQQQQPQPQYQIASVYPQLPSQDELPSYSPYPSPQYSQPQPQQYNKQHMPAPIQPQNSQQIANIVPVNELKTKSELVECPHCRQLVYTTLDYDAGLCTGLSIAGLFLAGCNNGLCLLPWLFPWTKDVSHQCPSCRERIATFTRLERDTRISSIV
ncbi:LITAF-like zinc ribbon domain-containing protein [Pilaira anomala]|nr:LITAF-like zinc ribbon domain-containing protein [Pilaira anomala]